MEVIRDQFRDGRRRMIDAFVALSTFAREAGVDEDVISRLHGDFFDGHVGIKDAFAIIDFRAWLGETD